MIVSNEFDVVIIGGGPVGLWLACELALAKVKVLVLERRTERVTQSRALTLHGRTLEVFALRGIAERFLSQGRPNPGFFFGGLDTLLDFSTLDSRFPFTLFLPQATTERLIEERALELGVDIRRGHLVEKVVQYTDSVIIRGRNGETPFSFAARYAAGADGARSIVRHALAIDFVGHPARHTMTLADVALDAPPERPLLALVNEAGGLILAPRGDGVHHRIGVIDASSRYLAPSEPVSLAEVAASAARIFGRDLRPRDPVWISRFTDESRLAECYRKERIFLAGDAAHINPPMGGQGMNVGIQDAMNLGWKLASVIHGTASDEILDSYQSERRPIGEALQDDTPAQFAQPPARGPTLRLWCRLSRTAVSGGAQLGPSERRERASSFRRRSCVEGRLANDPLPLSPRRSLGPVASRCGERRNARQGRNQPRQPGTWRQRRPARQLRFNACPSGRLRRPRTRRRRRRRHRVRRLIARAGPCSGSRRLHLCPSVLTTP